MKLHPALSDFPLALLSAALVSDLLFWRTGVGQWAQFSFYLITAGLLSGLAAGLTGLIDFLTDEQARSLPSGWFHFVLTDLAIFLTTFNWISRLYDRRDSLLFTGLALSATVAGLLLVAGFLGGRLVFHHRIGVEGPILEDDRGAN